MDHSHSIGGLDPRFAPRRTGATRAFVLLVAALCGAAVGVYFALHTVPHPHCVKGDGMCRLQKLYFAQAVKILAPTLLAFVIAEAVVVRIPNALVERRRSRAFGRAHPAPAPVIPSRRMTATTAREALAAVSAGTSLPPAALRALEARRTDQARALGPSTLQQARSTTSDPAEAARRALLAVNARTSLPPAALAALSGRVPSALGTGGPPPTRAGVLPPAAGRARKTRTTVTTTQAYAPAPTRAPVPPGGGAAPPRADRAGARAEFVLGRMGRGPDLPPAALEALLAQGPALGSRARPA